MSGYLGSKATSGLFQNIIAMMPPHQTYIVTHLGGGTIIKRKPPAMKNIGLDATALEKFSTAHTVELFNVCTHQFLSDYPFTGSKLIYCDPPYVRHTRASKNSKYRFEYSDQDHKDLLTLIKTLPCKFILSGYPSALYDDLLGDWHTMELQVMSQSAPALKNFGTTIPLIVSTGSPMRGQTLRFVKILNEKHRTGHEDTKHYPMLNASQFYRP